MMHAIVPMIPPGDGPSADFSGTPWWLTVLKVLFVFLYLLIQVLIVIWFERRVIGRMQQRSGPNRFGPWGIAQTLGDGWKLLMKETFVPANADKFMFLLAPIITASAAFITFATIPLSGTVNFFGLGETPLQITDTPVSVLIALAAAGIGAYGVVLAGWSSGSTYPLLGGLRGSAQVISYEIAMGLSLVAVFLNAGSMSTSRIVDAQRVPILFGHWPLWFFVPAFLSFCIYVVTMFGETNRLPFDLSEGEGELVAGYQSEYSGMRWGMFFLGEYINMFTVSGLATTMFLGGWSSPIPGVLDAGWWGFLWFTLKMWFFIWLFVWVRGTLPRTRYDQFMKFGWKFLIPLSVLWVLVVALFKAAKIGYLGENTGLATFIVFALTVVIVLAVMTLWFRHTEKAARKAPVPAEIDPFAGGFPVPPMPGQTLREPRRPRDVPVRAAVTGEAHTTEPLTTDVRPQEEADRG